MQQRSPWARVGVAVLALAATIGLASVPLSAAADTPTTIAFVDSAPQTVEFGDPWLFVLAVAAQYEDVPNQRLNAASGSVDIYLSGVGGAYVTGLPIQPDGTVYFSQPSNQPLLGAGDYDVSAIFNPAGGTFLDTSQTATSAKLSITALGVDPTSNVSNDPAVSDFPVINASIAGSYVDKTGGAPSGTWSFSVKDTEGAVAFSAEVPQELGGTEPVRVEITAELDRGTTYVLTTVFTPVDELAAGIEVAATPDVVVTTPGGSFIEALALPVPLSWWLLALLIVLTLGTATTALVLGIKLRGGAPREKAPAGIPGDPENVELITWEEAGIHDEETKALPKTWSLSELEPSELEPTDPETELLTPEESDGAGSEK